MLDTFQLNRVRLELEERKTYLYVRVSGELSSPEEVERVAARMSWWMEKQQLTRVLADARELNVPLPDEACHATWEWIHARRYEQFATVLPAAAADLVLTRMNMTSVSSGLPFRGFASVVDAHRWLDPRLSGVMRRSSSISPSTVPPGTAESIGSQPPHSRRPSGLFSAAAQLSSEPAPPRSKRASDPD